MQLLCLVPTQPSDCKRMLKSVTKHLLFCGWLVQMTGILGELDETVCGWRVQMSLVFLGCWLRLSVDHRFR